VRGTTVEAPHAFNTTGIRRPRGAEQRPRGAKQRRL